MSFGGRLGLLLPEHQKRILCLQGHLMVIQTLLREILRKDPVNNKAETTVCLLKLFYFATLGAKISADVLFCTKFFESSTSARNIVDVCIKKCVLLRPWFWGELFDPGLPGVRPGMSDQNLSVHVVLEKVLLTAHKRGPLRFSEKIGQKILPENWAF